MWRWKRGKQSEPSERRPGSTKPEEQAEEKAPGGPHSSQIRRIKRLMESGRHRTALDEVLRGLRKDPDDFVLLGLGSAIAGVSRTDNLAAAEPTTPAQRRSALLAPIVTQCSSCGATWYPGHWAAPAIDTIWNPAGLQCQQCRYTLCRDCVDHSGVELRPDEPVDSPKVVMDGCPEHGVLGARVLATGRNDIPPMDPDRIEAVIVTREGPIPPTMDQALAIVTKFLPLIADDAPLIHIRASKPGLMADESGRDELALARIHDLEREGVLAPGAWNRSERMFIEARDMPDTNYLLTVIRKGNKNGPHELYGLFAGMTEETLLALVGTPESHVVASGTPQNRRSSRRRPKDPEHWLYSNTPPGIDTDIVVVDGVIKTVEMKSREDGELDLTVTTEGTFTPIVGYAAYALMLLLVHMPTLDDADIERIARQVRPKFPKALWTTVPLDELVRTAADMLRPWSQQPRHGKYALVRRNRGVLIANDALRVCGFWQLTNDRVAVGLLDGK